jgi:hypothetical protein
VDKIETYEHIIQSHRGKMAMTIDDATLVVSYDEEIGWLVGSFS